MKINTFQNMGDGDRVIRFVAGALLIGFTMGAAVEKLGWLSVLPLVAIPVIMTAILNWDPLYGLFNISTVKENRIKTLGFMASNVGRMDTVVRYVVGIALLLLTLAFAPTPIGTIALVPLAAAVLILTGIVGWDPLYSLFKLNTLEQMENLPKAVVIKADFNAARESEDVKTPLELEPGKPEKAA
ncbi:MAG: DUF2892 domain-containing protein [Gammaproteobacteria bacterium]|jgi:hypothetical protein